MLKEMMARLSRTKKVSAAFAVVVVAALGTAVGPSSSEETEIEIVDVPLIAWVTSRAHALPDSLVNFTTPDERTKQFRDFVEELATLDRKRAAGLAKDLAYQLVEIDEDGKKYLVASDDSGSGRDPTIVINTTPARDVILEAPHVPFEDGTAEQAVILLRDLDGVAAIVSGAHRCASKSFTTCDGQTSVCTGTPTQYPDSDVGHNTQTLFHTAHLVLADHWDKAVVVSLHGSTKDDQGEFHTSLIISDGANTEDLGRTHPATKLRVAMEDASAPGKVVSCNLHADDHFQARPLCGFTNIQGRNVNGDANECRDGVDQGTGRFIHMEQDPILRNPYAEHWSHIEADAFHKRLVEAFESAVPANP
jgi:hypothetical protein